MKSNIKDDIDIKSLYEKDGLSSLAGFIKDNKVKGNGLSSAASVELLKQNGFNQIKKSKVKKWYDYFFASLISPFNLILLGISLVLFYTDVVASVTPNYTNIIVILILVLVSTLLEFFEEYSSNKAAAKLKELVATTTTVIRDDKIMKIPVKEIVKGDVVSLSAGDMIPADLRIIEAKDLFVSQSSLTGESDAVKKVPETEVNKKDEDLYITDFDTICFMGTDVISGSARGVVIKTANDTYFGRISHTISSGKPETSFQKGIKSVSKLLIRFMLIMIPITFLLNVWKHNTLTAFTFSISIAIGITPLLLPVILSSSLARGATRMSKKKTIVKRLESIQSFGGMNILCTDKTGTLTQDKIVLEKYLDIKGEEDFRVLKHAYLNSFFQTGLRGNIDEAIIDRGNKNGLNDILAKYEKIDEIPFDFSRRRLSVVISDGTKKQLITKGAVEEILNICSWVDYQGTVSKITPAIKENVKQIAKALNKDGLRVVAVCQKNDILNVKNFSVADESKMVLMGFIGFLDPPKESAKDAIEKLNNAGIRVIVLTGDNAEVTQCICNKVNINTSKIVLGSQLDKLSDQAVNRLLREVNVFAKLSPIQKARIVRLLKEDGNTVGYMGDGINDSPSLINSDIGISVDSAVDIAKETADIILLEKDLHVLLDGVLEGRKTFCNIMKYIKLAASFNFGEVMSVLISSVLLPFLPITPIQLLVQSLLYDIGQLSLPYDKVDKSYLAKPRVWNMESLKRFMLIMGPLSSSFDLLIFSSLWFVFKLRLPDASTFQTIWFSYGVVSNLVGLHVIRTAKIPFVQSNASKVVYASSILLSLFAILVPFTFVGSFLGLTALPLKYILSIIIFVPILYCFVALVVKAFYIRKYKEWI